MVDALSEALIAFDADGTERYRNAAFRRLADVEPEIDQLAEAAHQLARDVRPALGPPSTAPDTRRSSGLSTTRMDLDLASGSYSLRAFMDASLLRDRCVLVIIERASALPPSGALELRFGLTPREAEVASLMAQGYPDKEIAERLSISPHTARRHAERVLRKMPVSSRAGIALACMQA
jgi:DNA-binding CsgD family transcriptional regulator